MRTIPRIYICTRPGTRKHEPTREEYKKRLSGSRIYTKNTSVIKMFSILEQVEETRDDPESRDGSMDGLINNPLIAWDLILINRR